MLVEHPFRLTNPSGDLVRGDFRYADSGGIRPLLLVCPGFTAHKDWGFFPYAGKRLAELGFATLVLNFSHNGVGDNSTVFTEYDKFSRNTPGKELEDVRCVLDALLSGEEAEGVVDPKRVAMVGHSRGGGISIITAREDTRVKAIALWSTVARFLRVTPHQREAWEKNGYLSLRYGSTRTMLRYDLSVLHDLERNAERYDLHRAVRGLSIPALFVHGAADIIVRHHEAEELYKDSDRTLTEFVLIEGAGHAYGIEHPFKQTTDHMERLLELTATWLHHTLS
jgi:pimeloyl-ACP methyl ester carboxylesterase